MAKASRDTALERGEPERVASWEYEIFVAFLDKDQGFALDGKFPWPYLR
jgi:hypothetical protein